MSAYISYEKRQIIIPGLKIQHWEFPGGSVVKTLGFHCRSMGLIPGGGTEIPQPAWPGQKQSN